MRSSFMSYIDKLAYLHIRERKVLTARSKNNDTFYIPGGKRELGESDQQALMREVYEELTIKLLPNTIQYIGQFEAQAHNKPEGVKVRMTCYDGDYEGIIKASSEIEEIEWLKHADRYRTGYVDIIIFDWLKNKNLID